MVIVCVCVCVNACVCMRERKRERESRVGGGRRMGSLEEEKGERRRKSLLHSHARTDTKK